MSVYLLGTVAHVEAGIALLDERPRPLLVSRALAALLHRGAEARIGIVERPDLPLDVAYSVAPARLVVEPAPVVEPPQEAPVAAPGGLVLDLTTTEKPKAAPRPRTRPQAGPGALFRPVAPVVVEQAAPVVVECPESPALRILRRYRAGEVQVPPAELGQLISALTLDERRAFLAADVPQVSPDGRRKAPR